MSDPETQHEAEADNAPTSADEHELLAALERVATGDLTARMASSGDDQVSLIAGAVNAALDALRARVGRIDDAAAGVLQAVAANGTAIARLRRLRPQTPAREEDNASQTEGEHPHQPVQQAAKALLQRIEEAQAAHAELLNHAHSTDVETRKGATSLKRLGETAQTLNGIPRKLETFAEELQRLAVNAAIAAQAQQPDGDGLDELADEMAALAARCADEAQATIGVVNGVLEDGRDATHFIERSTEEMVATGAAGDDTRADWVAVREAARALATALAASTPGQSAGAVRSVERASNHAIVVARRLGQQGKALSQALDRVDVGERRRPAVEPREQSKAQRLQSMGWNARLDLWHGLSE